MKKLRNWSGKQNKGASFTDFLAREERNHKSYLSKIKKQHGLTEKDYRAIHSEQNGNCVICGTKEIKGERKLAIDHDHKTGKVRGLLCGNCNMALGLFGDDIDILCSAISYLKNSQLKIA